MMGESVGSDGAQDLTVKQMLNQTSGKLIETLDTSSRSAELVLALFDLYTYVEDPGALRMHSCRGRCSAASARMIRARLQRCKYVQLRLGLHWEKPIEMAPLIAAAEPVFRADPKRFFFELTDLNQTKAQYLRRTGKLEDAIKLLSATIPNAEIAYAGKSREMLSIYNNLLVYMVEANQLNAMPAIIARADAYMKQTGLAEKQYRLIDQHAKGSTGY